MDKKNIFVVGGSSGIGLEIVKKLTGDQNEIFVGSRTSRSLVEYPDQTGWLATGNRRIGTVSFE